MHGWRARGSLSSVRRRRNGSKSEIPANSLSHWAKSFVDTVTRRFKAACVELLKIDILRFQICRLRWMLYRTRLKVIDQQSQGVGTNTVSYNLGVFKIHAKLVFGMGKRMSLLLYPTAALLGSVPWANVLIVGP